MPEYAQHIGVLSVRLFIPSAQSLKDKRMILRSIKDRVRNQYNVSMAELDGQDKWQLATFGFAMIGNDRRYIDGALQDILNFVRSYPEVEISDSRFEFL